MADSIGRTHESSSKIIVRKGAMIRGFGVLEGEYAEVVMSLRRKRQSPGNHDPRRRWGWQKTLLTISSMGNDLRG